MFNKKFVSPSWSISHQHNPIHDWIDFHSFYVTHVKGLRGIRHFILLEITLDLI